MTEKRRITITEKGKTFMFFCDRQKELTAKIQDGLFDQWWNNGADPRLIDEYILGRMPV